MRRDLLDLLRCPATAGTLSLDVLERDGDDVRYGVLRSEAEEYPVLAGVPVLLPGHAEPVRMLRAGCTADATAATLLPQLAPSRLGRLATALGVVPRGAALGRALGRRERRRLRVALTPLIDPGAADPLALVRLGFDTWGGHNTEAVHYFTYRYGTPRHLVALAAAEAGAPAGDGPLLDLGCGVGQLTWWLDQRFGEGRTVGIDLSLFELWAAQDVAGAGRFVCADATALPLASGSFGLVLSSDVLSFVAGKWAVAREAARMLAPGGTMVFAAVKSSLQRHVYAGLPISPEGWRALAGTLPHRLYADDRILARYLAGQGLDGGDPGDPMASPTVTLVAGGGARGGGAADRDRPPTAAWPHACGPLGVHPLLRIAEERDGTIVYRRRFPSSYFADDNDGVRHYLPEQVDIPRAAVDGDRLDRRLVEHLIPSTAVLAMPASHRRANLPPAVRRAVHAS